MYVHLQCAIYINPPCFSRSRFVRRSSLHLCAKSEDLSFSPSLFWLNPLSVLITFPFSFFTFTRTALSTRRWQWRLRFDISIVSLVSHLAFIAAARGERSRAPNPLGDPLASPYLRVRPAKEKRKELNGSCTYFGWVRVGIRSGEATPNSPSRPHSSMSQQSASSVGSSNVNLRSRTAASRRPRPASIAGTGVSVTEKHSEHEHFTSRTPALSDLFGPFRTLSTINGDLRETRGIVRGDLGPP